MCKTKTLGGLGVKEVYNFNILLVKWKWRLGTKTNRLWLEVLKSNMDLGGISMSSNMTKNQSWWWRDLRLACEEGKPLN